jgi:hypothetical protein
LVILLICLLNPPVAWSSEISKVKGSQVLVVDFDGKVGQQFFAIDGNGKRRAIITITKARGGRAIGQITKGRAAVGYSLTERRLSRSRRGSASSALHLGAIFGYALDSMSVPVLNQTQDLTGSGFSVKAAADYNFSQSIGLRLLGGYEAFSVKNNIYSTDISYVTLDALGRYMFTPRSTFNLWIGAGLGFAIPFSKTTNILQEDSIATSTLLYVAGGFDIHLGGNFYFPVQVDYAMFLPASDVKTSIVGVRGGIMMGF